MYEWLVPRVVLPLVDRATGRRVGGRLRDLRERQWQSDDERDGTSAARLRRLLDHAAAHVPYYGRRLRDAGVGSGDIRSLADLALVPITTKGDLVAAGLAGTTAETLAAARGRLITTSGSSGVAFRFYVDMAAEDTRLATYLLALEWAGVAIWTPEVRVNNPFRDVSWVYGRPGPLARLGRRMLLGQRTFRMVAPRPTVADLEALIRRAERSGAFFMWGFSSLLALLGEQVLRAGTTLPSYPRVVVSRGERLTEVRRRTIRSAFQAPVVDHYGCTEMADLAQSCPDAPDGLHVLSDRVIIQVLREDGRPAGPGERGRVLLTDLENHVMPFINYAVGDWAVMGSRCSCRRGLPILTAIDGRDSEVLRLPSGDRVSGVLLEAYIRVACDLSMLREYQFIQKAVDRMQVRIVPAPGFSEAHAERLRRGLEKLLGPGLTVEIAEVAEIPSEPSGKRLVVKSEVA
jgi:phenylacetate-CoA ligase